LKGWREHFRNISNTAETCELYVLPITHTEIAISFEKIVNSEALERDDIPAEA